MIVNRPTLTTRLVRQRDLWFTVSMLLFVLTAVLAITLIHARQTCAQTIIQPPVGVPSSVYTSPSGITTITPPAGAPTTIYPATPSNPVTTIQPAVGLPTYIYGR